MSDDLVKDLRAGIYTCDGIRALRNKAAHRIEKLEAALIDILKVPRSEASWGIALVIARKALEEKDD